MSARLDREDVRGVYARLLEREAAAEEIDQQLASVSTIAALLDVVLSSAEYAARGAPAAIRNAPLAVNHHQPGLERWMIAPGTRSADGVAVVGREGWLFLADGSNAIVDQFTGALAMSDGWLAGWTALAQARAAAVGALGAQMAMLVVPDKLAVLVEHFPEPLERRGPRPVDRLLEAGLPLVYPLAGLREGPADRPSYLRTDTHLTWEGNLRLARRLDAAMGVEVPPSARTGEPVQHLISGDLGSRFDPAFVEVVEHPGTYAGARVVEDNHAEITGVGGHLGVRRVYRNDTAPDERTVLLFGDSYGFGSDGYQGVAWHLAQHFRCVHFVWVPMGWDPRYAEQTGAQLVVFQTAERFLARIPQPSVDVRELARETLARRSAAGLGQVFAD